MPKCDFNKIAATLLKLHFCMGVLLYIYCIFPEHLFSKKGPGWLLLHCITNNLVSKNVLKNGYYFAIFKGSISA